MNQNTFIDPLWKIIVKWFRTYAGGNAWTFRKYLTTWSRDYFGPRTISQEPDLDPGSIGRGNRNLLNIPVPQGKVPAVETHQLCLYCPGELHCRAMTKFRKVAPTNQLTCHTASSRVALPTVGLKLQMSWLWFSNVTFKLSEPPIKTHYSLLLGFSANGLMRGNYGLQTFFHLIYL